MEERGCRLRQQEPLPNDVSMFNKADRTHNERTIP
jgi:hypothetical protein